MGAVILNGFKGREGGHLHTLDTLEISMLSVEELEQWLMLINVCVCNTVC